MPEKIMCDVACRFFEQKMNSPIKGKYSGYCGARGDKIIFSEDVSKYDRYGTATRLECLAPETKSLDEGFWRNIDPFGSISFDD